MNEIDYERLASAIAEKMRNMPPHSEVLWCAQECADYLHVSKLHFKNRISKAYGFPAGAILPSEKGISPRIIWHAVDVEEWAKRQKLKKAS